MGEIVHEPTRNYYSIARSAIRKRRHASSAKRLKKTEMGRGFGFLKKETVIFSALQKYFSLIING